MCAHVCVCSYTFCSKGIDAIFFLFTKLANPQHDIAYISIVCVKLFLNAYKRFRQHFKEEKQNNKETNTRRLSYRQTTKLH